MKIIQKTRKGQGISKERPNTTVKEGERPKSKGNGKQVWCNRQLLSITCLFVPKEKASKICL